MVEAKLPKIAFHTGLYKSADISHDCKRALRFKKKKKKNSRNREWKETNP